MTHVTSTNPPITATISDFLRLSGLGKSSAYALIASGEIKTVMYGRRRLIVIDSYRQWIARQIDAKA